MYSRSSCRVLAKELPRQPSANMKAEHGTCRYLCFLGSVSTANFRCVICSHRMNLKQSLMLSQQQFPLLLNEKNVKRIFAGKNLWNGMGRKSSVFFFRKGILTAIIKPDFRRFSQNIVLSQPSISMVNSTNLLKKQPLLFFVTQSLSMNGF